MRLEHWFYTVPLRLRSLFRRDQVEAELDEEMQYHLERQIEVNLAGGMPEEEARYAAMRTMHGLDQRKEECRDMRRVRFIEELLQDCRFGLRTLTKRPLPTAVALLTVALAVGANTAIFSVVNTVLLRPLPYPEPDKLVMLWEGRIREGTTNGAVSPADFSDWRARNQVFIHTAAMIESSFDLSETNEPERVTAGQVSASFFEVLGIEPMLGRGFLAEEERAGHNRAVVINHDLWQRRFGADPNVIGRRISLSGLSFEVVGVLPSSFRFPNEDVSVWLPLNHDAESMQTRTNHFLSVFARLKPGVTIEQAQNEMENIGAQLMREYPQENDRHSAVVMALHEQLTGDLRRPLLILFAAVGVVLLIACANLANLQLVRANARQKEMALRAALGAGYWRIARQLITESVLVAAFGGALGILLAWLSVGMVTALLPEGILHVTGVQPDLRVFGFTLAILLITGVLPGLAALLGANVRLDDTLKKASRGGVSAHQRGRGGVVVVQLALAIVLLIGAGLMIRSLWKLQRVSPGFDPQDVLTAQIVLPSARYREPELRTRFFQRLSERLSALPGVQAVGVTSILPLVGAGPRTSISIEGRAEMTNLLPQARPRIHTRTITPDYFEAMGIPLLGGRFLNSRDTLNTPIVALINQKAAQRYWPGQSPLGQRVQIGGGAPWSEVVGIVGDVKQQGLDKEINPEVYFAWAQSPQRDGTLVVRGQNVVSMVPVIRGQVQQLDKELPLSNLRLLEEVVERSTATPRSYTLLLTVFAGIALTLATVGIYGVMAYSVTHRTHEIGVRIAVGAQMRDVLGMVMKEGMRLTLVGVALGLVAAWGLTRWLNKLLYEVSATDPLTIAFVAFFLVSVALFACYLPARRAVKVDPLVALRHDE
jgi:putative ABC transport system permease protein